MKNFTILIFTCLFIQVAWSQSCLPEGIVFRTQEQIDHFQNDYHDCSVIEGDVIISGNDITNLDGLNVLISFRGTTSWYPPLTP